MPPPPDNSNLQHTRHYLSPQEFSQLSGLSLATVHRYLKKGNLPFQQPGGPRSRILIPAEVLVAIVTVTPGSTSKAVVPAPVPKPIPHTPKDPVRLPGPRPRWTLPAGSAQNKET